MDFIYCAVDKPFSIVYWNEGKEQWESTVPNDGDAYIVEDNGSNYARHLLIAVDGKWKDAGLFKGEQGNAGEDGKSA